MTREDEKLYLAGLSIDTVAQGEKRFSLPRSFKMETDSQTSGTSKQRLILTESKREAIKGLTTKNGTKGG